MKAPMKIVLRREVCSGHGRCYALAPDVFQPDDTGYCDPRFAEVPAELVRQARLGATNCPEDAISLVEEAAMGS